MAIKKKKSSKKANTSTIAPKKKTTKKRPYTYFDEYRDLFTGRMKPVSDAFLDRLSQDLIDWVIKEEHALILKVFFREKGIGYRTAQKWAKRSPRLREAMDDAKDVIGSRREIGALMRIYDSGMVKLIQHFYDPEWKKSEEWRAELKAKQDEKAKNNNIQWVLEKFPNSKLVPEKKDD